MPDTDVWADDDLDYTSLLAGLSRPSLLAKARFYHGGEQHFNGSLKIYHLNVVAELAQHYSQQFFLRHEDWGRRYFRECAWAAGLLHEALLAGANFESLVLDADEHVARAVAFVTPDIRQPWSKRIETYVNHLGLGDTLAQIVKLADLKHDLVLLAARLNDGADEEELVDTRYRLKEARAAALALTRLQRGGLKTVLEQVRLQARELELRANKKKLAVKF